MIENFNEKVKIWEEIQKRIFTVFHIYDDLYRERYPNEFLDFQLCEDLGEDFYIEYNNYTYGNKVPQRYSFRIPKDYISGERTDKEIEEFFIEFTLASDDIINRL